VARAVQFFVPGIPQVYYVGLLAGTNDMDLLAHTKVGRDINRHYYTASELNDTLCNPVVRNLLDLIRLRNTHPAFAGQAHVETPSHQALIITWRLDVHWAKLEVNFSEPRALITYSKTSATDKNQSVLGEWESFSSNAARS
jgi:sucrose phosphorylase